MTKISRLPASHRLCHHNTKNILYIEFRLNSGKVGTFQCFKSQWLCVWFSFNIVLYAQKGEFLLSHFSSPFSPQIASRLHHILLFLFHAIIIYICMLSIVRFWQAVSDVSAAPLSLCFDFQVDGNIMCSTTAQNYSGNMMFQTMSLPSVSHSLSLFLLCYTS